MSEKTETQKPRFERKGFWFERAPDGSALFCFRDRVNGKKVRLKLPVPEIVRMSKDFLSGQKLEKT
jgi:hypothetical protein